MKYRSRINTLTLASDFLVVEKLRNWVTAVVWPFAKLSLCLLYIQLFRPMKWLRYCSYASATVNILFYISVLTATLAFTVPAPGQTLQQVVQSPREAQARSLTIPITSMSLVLDVYILILPIAGVSQLQLPFKQKIGCHYSVSHWCNVCSTLVSVLATSESR